jgi:hypothetical protein
MASTTTPSKPSSAQLSGLLIIEIEIGIFGLLLVFGSTAAQKSVLGRLFDQFLYG